MHAERTGRVGADVLDLRALACAVILLKDALARRNDVIDLSSQPRPIKAEVRKPGGAISALPKNGAPGRCARTTSAMGMGGLPTSFCTCKATAEA